MKNKFSYDNLLPHQNIILSVKVLLLMMFIFTLLRFVFYVLYSPQFYGVPISEIGLSFLIGLRFDLASTLLVGGLFLLLLNLPGRFKFKRFYKISIISLLFLVVIASIILSLGDIFYYPYAKRRISYEIFNLFKSIPELITIILNDYLVPLIIAVAVVILLGYLWFKLFGKYKSSSYKGIVNDLIYFILLIGVIVISIRGGFQLKPLRESYAFRNDNIALGHLSLNAVFTTLRTLNRGDIQSYNFIPMNEAIKSMRDLLKSPKEIYLDEEYPLMRQTLPETKHQNKLNVVIIVMESWPGNFAELETIKPFPMPEFRKLMNKGIYFSNFFAAGQRTIQGMQAVVGSIPNVVYDDILGSPIEQNFLRPLGVILKEGGYSTIFLHGARSGSMGFEAFSKLAGFDTYISKSDFDLNKVKDDGTWGIFDHFVFERSNQEFNKIKQPFLGLVMSLSSHAPYALPSGEYEVYDSTIANYKFLNSLRYSDWSLGKFFEEAEKAEYFRNTLFIITADHAEGTREKNIYELFKIPCLLYSPAFLNPDIISSVHSQVDILPTIIDILKLQTKHSSFGLSAIAGNNGFAYLPSGGLHGWIKGDWLSVGDFDKNIALYNYKTDRHLSENKLNLNPNTANVLRKEMLSYLQVSTYLLRSNKVYKSE
ncbi:MAG: sulfatase-like hydrolase/transferase [Bacteroidota bacterium]|nr:sulfatase-like hydrolase/transferase [Bacteroidota bacterium]